MYNISVMASGAGSTFRSLAESSRKNRVNYKINALLTNVSNAGCIEVAINLDIMCIVVTPENCWDLLPENTDLVVLAGWLKLLTVPQKWMGKVVNIHPSLLPKFGGKGFYGINVHKAVIEAGETKSGCTVHLVNNMYDEGEILEQHEIDIKRFETSTSLQARVKSIEREVYPIAIDSYLKKLKEDSK